VAEKQLVVITDADKITMSDRWITMSNALTRAGHGLTLSEKRLVVMALSKLDSMKPFIKDTIYRTKITAAEYASECDVSMDTAYDQLQSASKGLFDSRITFYEPAHKREGRQITPTQVNMRWVGEANYQKGEGWIELHWWPDTAKHLIGLKRQFTSYKLQQATALRSIYSWRLLELLMRFESTGWAEYTIEDFAVSMDATDKQKADFAAIRRKMIEPAIKELQEKDGWLITWDTIKTGRKIKSVRFEFTRNKHAAGKKAE
jgi:plasmid replication initiation protein